jgi:glyoxylase-like metal-dependent hydrolase (beta-lactamase superfamily II)
MLLIPAGNPSLWTGPTGTNTYLLPGRVPTIVDAGVGHAEHLTAVEAALAGRTLALVLLTHGHVDHASGVPALLERWPAAVVRPSSRALVDRESIEAGDGALTALFTPGHAPDHFCFVDEDRREVYCGDLLRAGGTVVIPASRGGDLKAYLDSLRRLRDLHPRRLWPGHGPAIDEPEKLIDEYLAHRAQREVQILDALRRGVTAPEAMVGDVYGTLPEKLVAAATDSILAHLRKLEADGAATCAEGRWKLRS